LALLAQQKIASLEQVHQDLCSCCLHKDLCSCCLHKIASLEQALQTSNAQAATAEGAASEAAAAAAQHQRSLAQTVAMLEANPQSEELGKAQRAALAWQRKAAQHEAALAEQAALFEEAVAARVADSSVAAEAAAVVRIELKSARAMLENHDYDKTSAKSREEEETAGGEETVDASPGLVRAVAAKDAEISALQAEVASLSAPPPSTGASPRLALGKASELQEQLWAEAEALELAQAEISQLRAQLDQAAALASVTSETTSRLEEQAEAAAAAAAAAGAGHGASAAHVTETLRLQTQLKAAVEENARLISAARGQREEQQRQLKETDQRWMELVEAQQQRQATTYEAMIAKEHAKAVSAELHRAAPADGYTPRKKPAAADGGGGAAAAAGATGAAGAAGAADAGLTAVPTSPASAASVDGPGIGIGVLGSPTTRSPLPPRGRGQIEETVSEVGAIEQQAEALGTQLQDGAQLTRQLQRLMDGSSDLSDSEQRKIASAAKKLQNAASWLSRTLSQKGVDDEQAAIASGEIADDEDLKAAGERIARELTVGTFRELFEARGEVVELDVSILHFENAPQGQTLQEFAALKLRKAEGYRTQFGQYYAQACEEYGGPPPPQQQLAAEPQAAPQAEPDAVFEAADGPDGLVAWSARVQAGSGAISLVIRQEGGLGFRFKHVQPGGEHAEQAKGSCMVCTSVKAGSVAGAIAAALPAPLLADALPMPLMELGVGAGAVAGGGGVGVGSLVGADYTESLQLLKTKERPLTLVLGAARTADPAPEISGTGAGTTAALQLHSTPGGRSFELSPTSGAKTAFSEAVQVNEELRSELAATRAELLEAREQVAAKERRLARLKSKAGSMGAAASTLAGSIQPIQARVGESVRDRNEAMAFAGV